MERDRSMSIIDPGFVEPPALTARVQPGDAANGHTNGEANGHTNGHVNGLLNGELLRLVNRQAPPAPEAAPEPPDPEALRRAAWDIGARRPADQYTPDHNHVGLAMVGPCEGFAHWRLLHGWVERVAGQRGDSFRDCRMVVRFYDISYVEFNGFNAHRLHDVHIKHLTGQLFFKLPRPGTWQLAEVGFLLRSGEFIPGARSLAAAFAADAVSGRSGQAALLVDDRLRKEEVASLWEQGRVLAERARPKLRGKLRLAAFSWEAPPRGEHGTLARFVAGLASGQAAHGHEAFVFAPARPGFEAPCQIDGVQYQPLTVKPAGSPVERAVAFARAAEERLEQLPPFDLFHVHEWTAGVAPWIGTLPTVLSLSSTESVRRNGGPANELSQEVQRVEREVAQSADRILTPDWLRERAAAELGVAADKVAAFPMESRLPNEWELPLDLGLVKVGVGFGPMDRLVLFIGPLEHAAGPDLLLEALPTLLGRCPGLRLAFVGAGGMWGHLERRTHELGLAHMVRLLGHMEGPPVKRLMRAAEVLALPSRHRLAGDDGAVDLARCAGRPVVTTHAGPAHLVRHEENGVLTYDNPGSMVWALERLLRDPGHAERLGLNGRRTSGGVVGWDAVAQIYLDLCAASFPELTEPRDRRPV
jgi:glycosyltransferase involved in cell wall biosynthesis